MGSKTSFKNRSKDRIRFQVNQKDILSINLFQCDSIDCLLEWTHMSLRWDWGRMNNFKWRNMCSGTAVELSVAN